MIENGVSPEALCVGLFGGVLLYACLRVSDLADNAQAIVKELRQVAQESDYQLEDQPAQ